MKMKKQILFVLLIGAVSQLSAQVQLLKVYENKYSAPIGTYQGIQFREGGFSGLCLIPGTDGKEFYTLSDRGVNIDAKNASCTPTYDKIYSFPNYAPKIHRVKLNGDSVQILKSFNIKRPNGTNASGIINPTGFGSTSTEKAWSNIPTNCADPSTVEVAKDVWGIDCEGIAIGKNNDFWVCEEGGPTVWNIGADGKVIKRYSPYANQIGAEPQDVAIDTVFKYRKNNRGFEGVAITPSGKVYAIIQSAMLNPNKTDGELSNVHRILEIDPVSGMTKMYAYLNPGINGTSPNKISAKDWKIGDLTAVNDTVFLVIEQGVGGTNVQRNIYQISIKGATPISSTLYGGKTVEQLKDAAGLAANSIVPVSKKLFVDLKASGWPDVLEKAEGLAIVNDSTIAVSNDNDFGQWSATENGIATVNNISSYIYTFGLKGSNKIMNYVAQSNVVNIPTLIENEDVSINNDLFEVYPNPVKDVLVIRMKEKENASVELVDLGGRIIKKLQFNNEILLNMNDMAKGVYVLKVDTGDQFKAVKIIKE
jgi:hypothetical protein